MTVDVGAANAQVSGYDTLTVTIDSLDGAGKVLGIPRIAEGSPFVSYTAAQSGQITSTLQFAKAGDCMDRQGRLRRPTGWSSTAARFRWHRQARQRRDCHLVRRPARRVGRQARSSSLLIRSPAAGSTTVSTATTCTTTLTYEATGTRRLPRCPISSKAWRPARRATSAPIPSIYGTLKLCSGSELTWSSPLSEPKASLGSRQRSALTQRKELTDAGQKGRCRAAGISGRHLLRRQGALPRRDALPAGQQLDAEQPAADLKAEADRVARSVDRSARLRQTPGVLLRLRRAGQGIVGLTPSFGSDEFNDHHFHYGYFLYAAGVLAAERPGPGQAVCAGHEPGRGRHRVVG